VEQKPYLETKRKRIFIKMVLCLVTGANRGIGFEIVKQLGGTPNVHCIMTARNSEEGQKVANSLKEEGKSVEFHQLDITSRDSIEQLAKYLEGKGGLDVLINNAGFAYKGNIFGAKEAQITLETNLFGTINLTNRLLPLLKNREYGGRIIHVASMAGRLSLVSSGLQAKLTSEKLTEEELIGLANSFVSAIEKGKHQEEGWPNSMYGVSKLLLIAYSKIQARSPELKAANITVNSMCPGYCKTGMTSWQGRDPAVGAETATFLALHQKLLPNGEFFQDKAPFRW